MTDLERTMPRLEDLHAISAFGVQRWLFMQRVSWDCAVFIGEDAGAFGCADCFPRSHALELAFCVGKG